jgi:hypothetical protein
VELPVVTQLDITKALAVAGLVVIVPVLQGNPLVEEPRQKHHFCFQLLLTTPLLSVLEGLAELATTMVTLEATRYFQQLPQLVVELVVSAEAQVLVVLVVELVEITPAEAFLELVELEQQIKDLGVEMLLLPLEVAQAAAVLRHKVKMFLPVEVTAVMV